MSAKKAAQRRASDAPKRNKRPLPDVRSPYIVAICCSDIHLSHKPPIARSAEPDWYAAMQRPLDEIKALQEEYGRIPVICAGDIFDKYNPPPRLINFAMEHLPQPFFAVPGQHDLHHHNAEDIDDTAFATLCLAGKISLIPSGTLAWSLPDFPLRLFGFGWGDSLRPMPKGYDDDKRLNVAVVHHYVWTQNFQHMGSLWEDHIVAIQNKLAGYNLCIFGDNHKGFLGTDLNSVNCGTLMRRKIDEIKYKPQVGLIRSDGIVIPHILDCSADKFIDTDLLQKVALESDSSLEAVVQELQRLADDHLNYAETVKRTLNLVSSPGMRQIVLDALGEK